MKLGFVVLTGFSLVTAGCVRPIDLRSNDLPIAAVGGVSCGGSTMAQGALAATPASFAAGGASVPRAPKAVLYSAPSQEDSTATALYVVNRDGSQRKEIMHGFFDANDPVVSPDGTLVAFIRQSASLEHARLMVAGVDGGNLRMLYRSADYVNSASWSPDSRRIAFLADGRVRTVGRDGDRPAMPIAEIHDDTADVETSAVAWSPDGGTIAFTDGGWVNGHWLGLPMLTIVAPDGSRRRELVTTTGYFAWSPRGDALAFTNRGISIVQVGGGKLRHLVATPEGTVVGSLSWSPDGGSIVFQSGDLDVVDLCRVSADGTTLTQLAACMPNNSGYDLSSDGQAVVFIQSTGPDCDHSPDSRIVVVPLNGGPMSVLAQEGRSPQWLGG